MPAFSSVASIPPAALTGYLLRCQQSDHFMNSGHINALAASADTCNPAGNNEHPKHSSRRRTRSRKQHTNNHPDQEGIAETRVDAVGERVRVELAEENLDPSRGYMVGPLVVAFGLHDLDLA
ncbi:hypothetical protein KC329_g33 [Hortaea werneckii]|nr:hypothetical protein KC329_g33 [Hortaea werneckii]